MLAVRATPRVPDPDKASAHQDDLDAKATEAEERMINVDMLQGDVEKPQGADLGTKMRPNRGDESRELRISDRILEKYGYSDGCAGCRAKLHGLPQRRNEPSCRLRIYNAMNADPEEFDNLERAITRTQGRSIAEGVVIPSESQEQSCVLPDEPASAKLHAGPVEPPGYVPSRSGVAEEVDLSLIQL